MDSGQNEDKWAALTESLGVEPKQQPAADPAPKPPVESPKPSVVQHKEPSRPSSGWGDLASQFGLEPESPAEPPATEPEAQSKPVDTIAAAESDPQTVEAEEPPVEPPRADKDIGSEPEPVSSVDADDVSDFDAKSNEDLTGGFAEEPKTETQALPIESSAEPDNSDKPSLPTAPAGFAGTGLTLPDWFPFGGRKKQEPATPVSPTPQAHEIVEDVTTEATTEEANAESPDLAATDDAGDSEESEAAEAKPRGRRRRGRRRGRGRKSNAESRGDSSEFESSAEGDADGEGDASELGEGDAHVDKVRSVSHKNIPAWQEAIGVVVDANIAARSERKRTNRGRGGSRGGRGRRRSGGGSKQEG